MTELSRFLTLWFGRPFAWGDSDCCLALADWVIAARGLDFDPADHLRGMYDDIVSCNRLTGFLRDPVAVIEGCAARVPLARTDDPAPGDIGLVQVVRGTRLNTVGAIRTPHPGQWAAHAPWGVSAGRPAAVLAAWSVGWAP